MGLLVTDENVRALHAGVIESTLARAGLRTAVVVLAAFTVELATSFVLRPGPPAPRRPA